MNVAIVAIADRGVANKERLHLSVLADSNLNFFVVFSTEKTPDGKILSTPKSVHWFTDWPVKAGDHVVLYTGHGTAKIEQRTDGFRNHFLYWSSSTTLWGKPAACAVVLEITTWATST